MEKTPGLSGLSDMKLMEMRRKVKEPYFYGLPGGNRH
jgi:hypothetical protein